MSVLFCRVHKTRFSSVYAGAFNNNKLLFQKQVMGQIFSFMKLLWKMNSKLKLWPKSTGFVKKNNNYLTVFIIACFPS